MAEILPPKIELKSTTNLQSINYVQRRERVVRGHSPLATYCRGRHLNKHEILALCYCGGVNGSVLDPGGTEHRVATDCTSSFTILDESTSTESRVRFGLIGIVTWSGG